MQKPRLGPHVFKIYLRIHGKRSLILETTDIQEARESLSLLENEFLLTLKVNGLPVSSFSKRLLEMRGIF